MTFCGYDRALEILADDLAPYWDKAEAKACIEWTEYWGEMKSYLKHCGQW